MPTTIPLSEAKSSLSSLIKDVSETGSEYIVTVRDKPAAMIIPMPKPKPNSLNAFGALAGKRPVASPKEEKASWAEAMEAKHV